MFFLLFSPLVTGWVAVVWERKAAGLWPQLWIPTPATWESSSSATMNPGFWALVTLKHYSWIENWKSSSKIESPGLFEYICISELISPLLLKGNVGTFGPIFQCLRLSSTVSCQKKKRKKSVVPGQGHRACSERAKVANKCSKVGNFLTSK